jgi:ABC-type transporter Mla subunit MlaD
VDQISDQLVKLTNQANGVIAKMGPALDNANATLSNANATISSLRQPAQVDLDEVRKTLVALQAQMRAKDQDLTYTLENVRMITDNLNELTESLKERPWSLVRIREAKDRKVPPLADAK